MDLDWLRGEVERTLAKNRVTVVRACNGPGRQVTYHAPYLHSQVDYPGWLPEYFHFLWKPWQKLKEPWQVRYPHQWLWDSASHAIVLSRLDPDLAKSEVRSLICAQDEQGFIPHLIWNPKRMHWLDRMFHFVRPKRPGSPYLQPPILAQVVEQIHRETGDDDFVSETVPSLIKFYLYIDRVRARSGDGLAEIITSYESGKDRSREYDLVYEGSNTVPPWRGPMTRLQIRYMLLGWDIERIFASNRFRVKDLLFNCIYAQNLSSLSRLLALVGDPDQASLFQKKAEQTEKSILTKMYDPESGLFFSLDSRNDRDRQIKVSTVSSLMPLILDSISQPQVERLISEHMVNSKRFRAPYPIPTEPLDRPIEKAVDNVIWRGCQTWGIINWYIVSGIRKQASRFPEHFEEYHKIADEITLKTYELVCREGFREYYNSESGRGYRARDFGMSTLILDMAYNYRGPKPKP
ncbi:trehalase family glycosidase [Chloroflexota bacterium]